MKLLDAMAADHSDTQPEAETIRGGGADPSRIDATPCCRRCACGFKVDPLPRFLVAALPSEIVKRLTRC